MSSADLASLRIAEDRIEWGVHVGDHVRFRDGHKRPWTVRAVSQDGRFAICTKPYNVQHTCLYTIIDFKRDVRGPDNMVFSHGYETPEDIAERMAELESGELEVSWRTWRSVPLAIETVTRA